MAAVGLPPDNENSSFAAKYSGSCFCKRVKFEVSADPVAAQISDCSVNMRLHAAPMQWGALFKKDAVRFSPESIEWTRWYNASDDQLYNNISEKKSPCKWQCKHCGTWIADEDTDSYMLFPTLFEFVTGKGKPEFPSSFLPTSRNFCETRALESDDGLACFKDDNKTPLTTTDFLKAIAPKLDGRSHKGQSGRICVLGGSIDFAGAPYYAGMSALRAGAELLYLCTALEATGPIKGYSPELMVSEVYRWSHISSEDAKVVANEITRMHEKMRGLLPRFHAMTIGPGLGRDDRVLQAVKMVILSCKETQLPLVIDADGLWLIEREPAILQGYTNAILTPNAAECGRLAKALMGRTDADPQEICNKLNGPILLQKGRIDRIYSPGGGFPVECAEEGAPRRPGGLGDFLSGSLATILAWAVLECKDKRYACQAACTLVRRACKYAYEKKKRAMVAPDVLDELAATFDELCPAPSPTR